jgi:hypothetical protein
MDPMIATLRRVRRRMAVQQWFRFNVIGLLITASAGCATVLFSKLFPLLGSPELVCLGLLVAGFLAATAWAIHRRPRLVDAALEADRRLGLQERVTSSLALENMEGPMVAALHADARRRLADVNVLQAFPLYPPRSARWLFVPILAIGLAGLLPEFDLLKMRERQAEAKAQQDARRVTAEALKSMAKPLKESARPSEPGTLGDLPMELELVAEQLAAGKITEKQAAAKLSGLAEAIQSRREELTKEGATMPSLPESMNTSGETKDLAKSIQQGDFGKAAEEVEKLKKKLEKGDLSAEDQKKLGEALKNLSEALAGEEGAQKNELSEALAKAAESLINQAKEGQPGGEGMKQALENMQAAQLSLEDMKSVLDQLEKLDAAMLQMAQLQNQMLGESKFCRTCGSGLKPCKGGAGCKGCGPGYACQGYCGACMGAGFRLGQGRGMGMGMGGPGRGRGNTTGPLPDVADAFEPTMLPGEMTQGKILADIIQRTTPDEEDANPTVDYIEGVFQQVEQQAEQALTKEEIPAGAKEFVRQYFGSLEPQGGTAPEEAAEPAAEDHTGHTHPQ